ncbi:mechanosensitive ion channel [Dysgonomonas capnocytophagoides]|uniref:Mechanosensitive ion channel n=1 Tax=Dysgonomonas capnocytophagoides TaxID=45254 RepID=A0A4Y8L078_9BACT|nr:mechanosensitive ion channel domain-containing protein [Dysgonomonas capnocytophagoides]TFD96043.1 mechanosensitive ion channel [Dysgonomonas capnocytophagoides]
MLNFILLQSADNLDISALDTFLHSAFTKAVDLGERIVLAVVIFFIGRWVIKWIEKLVARIMQRKHVEGAVVSFTNNMVDALLKIVLGLIIISVLGIETTSFAAILAAAGLAVGMAMKDNLSNFAGGVMILLNKPFKMGDNISAQGMDGIVREIGILYTVLLTGDNRTIYLPNGPLSTGTIINVTAQPRRRLDITLNINYGNSAEELKSLLTEVISRNDKVMETPTPFVGVTAINNGNFDIVLRVWVLTGDYGTVSVDLNEAIYKIFSEKGVYTSSTLVVKMVE